MSEGTDFALPEGDEHDEPADAPGLPARSQAPVIVIEYRSRGLATRLMPPALILLAALAITLYPRKTPVWPVAAAGARPAAAPVPAANPPAASKPAPEVAAIAPKPEEPAPPLAIAASPLAPEPTEAPLPPPGAPREPSPFDLDTDADLQPVARSTQEPVANPSQARTGAIPAVAPIEGNPEQSGNANAPEPSRDEILRDIAREADQTDAKRQDLEGLKTRAKSLLMNEALSRVQSDRASFHEDLKQLLAEFARNPAEAGKEIETLCGRYGKEPLPEVKRAYLIMLRTAPKRQTRQAKVEMMRAIGVPEALILDQICHELDKLINTRGGPRSEDEVRVRAAQALLAIPLNGSGKKPTRSTAGPQASVGVARGAAGRP